MLIIVPLEEQDVCWFYYLTRSPYQLNSIPAWLYDSAVIMRYIISIAEMGFLIYYVMKIRTMKMSQINIARESQLITIQWLLFTVLNLVVKQVEQYMTDPESTKVIQIMIFTFLCVRNLLASAIAYYYSIYLVNKDFEGKPRGKDDDLQ